MGVKIMEKKDKSVTVLLIILLVAAILLAGVATYVVISGQEEVPEQEPGNVANIMLTILPNNVTAGGTG